MSLLVKEDLIKVSKNRRPGTKLNWKYVTIHNTGNPSSTALNERAWLENPSNTRTASWHLVVHEDMIIKVIPLNEVAWHAGDSKGNNTSIGIEVCESGDFNKSLSVTAKLVAELLSSKGFGVDRIKKHKDWSGKECPRLIIPIWDNFISMVKVELGKLKEDVVMPDEVKEFVIHSWGIEAVDWAKANKISSCTDLNSQATRLEVIVMLFNLYKLLKKK